ncbi:MAG: hypothetical protein U1E20_15685 [Methylocystis sp.]|uniref:hypothetical protein n=1 Tax=Methylocystis sp. TaxID=1911079 RepID=UPI00392FCC6F
MEADHDRKPVILNWRALNWRAADIWMHGAAPQALLRPPPADLLREWIVSTRVNKAGVGDKSKLVDPV